MALTSDPHAWLRPYFAGLAEDHTFALRAPSSQFSALCDAVRDDQSDFRRTELHREADAATAKAAEWKTALLERGWQ